MSMLTRTHYLRGLAVSNVLVIFPWSMFVHMLTHGSFVSFVYLGGATAPCNLGFGTSDSSGAVSFDATFSVIVSQLECLIF